MGDCLIVRRGGNEIPYVLYTSNATSMNSGTITTTKSISNYKHIIFVYETFNSYMPNYSMLSYGESQALLTLIGTEQTSSLSTYAILYKDNPDYVYATSRAFKPISNTSSRTTFSVEDAVVRNGSPDENYVANDCCVLRKIYGLNSDSWSYMDLLNQKY